MNFFTRSLRLALLTASGALLLGAAGAASAAEYEVTVTNLTRGQQFTPILVATHQAGVRLFELGSPASPQLRTLAEEGNVGPLAALLLGNRDVRDVVNSGGLLNPGRSVTQRVSTQGSFDNVSVAAMLIPTNDAFFAVNDTEGQNGQESITLFSPAYDAGTERNDELCASIPGPNFSECGGPGGGGAPGGGEGYVHIHSGIHGIGDLRPAIRDWRNPVAKITIRRVNR
ncbi:MAG: spondin domain-containing protein [Chthoniobacteraceae bacterium]